MKKVGLITFHASYNCGSMLQAYALQQVIKNKYKIDNEIIDFSNISQRDMYSLVQRPSSLKVLLRDLYNLIFWRKITKHNRDYMKFSADNFCLSQGKYGSIEELNSASLDYDLYITGSDQVWNTKAKDFDDAYFLPFANDNRYSYAVSLGATNINQSAEVEKYRGFVNSFKAISVREKNAEKWIKELGYPTVKICADPTLLLNKEDWNRLASEREISGKYIFWYTMVYKDEISELVREISKKYNMPVYVIDAKEWSRRRLFLKGIKLAKNGGPSSFLSLVKNAELVITSSFHGTVFCSVFEKNFWYINIHDGVTHDDRASFLLDQLGLSDRLIKKNEVLSKNLMCPPIYDSGLKNDLLVDSFSYLEDILNR